MAIPVRLTVGNTANYRSINLEATGFNLAIERNISAFAMPFNNAFKAGVDPNMALTSINVQGVLTDDRSAPFAGVPESMIIDFSSYYGTSKRGFGSYQSGVMQDILTLHKPVSVSTREPAGSTTIATVTDPRSEFTSATSTIRPFGPKCYQAESGKEIGTITSLGSLALNMSGGSAVTLVLGERVVSHNPDTFLHGKGFLLMPQYWTIPGNEPDPNRPNTPIAYRFDGDNSPSVGGGSATPQFVTGSHPETGGIPTITIPIKGVFSTPTTNPARALAAIVKAAIENTTPVTTKKTTAAGGQSSNDTFSVTYADTAQTTLLIVQKNMGKMRYNIDSFPVHGLTGSGTQGILPWAYTMASRSAFVGAISNIEPRRPLYTEFQGGGEEHLPKSAGDKAQDLIGIFANSPVGTEDDIVGIQIPYDTLITSNSVSTEVRNFFLTFGKTITKDMKSSDGNTRPASRDMDQIGRSSDSETNVSGQSSSVLTNALEAIWEGVTNVIESVWITYDTKTSGNRGGMLIIPAKLAIHQEAGQPYYTFDMRLHAAQHKIAP